MKQFLKIIISSILLLVIGFFTSNLFLKISLSLSSLDKGVIAVTGTKDIFNLKIGFSLSLATIPLLIFMVKKIVKTISKSQLIFSSIIISLTGVLLWGYRLWTLNEMSQWPTTVSEYSTDALISINMLKLNHFILLGFLLGTVLSGLIYKWGNKNEMVTPK